MRGPKPDMGTQELPLRSKNSMENPPPYPNDDPVTTIHSIGSRNGVLVKIQPPIQPLNTTIPHVPCDIVLVIDISSSMDDSAPAAINDEQGNAKKEHFGLSILDLTKHAARTIISTLDEGDRLGVVTFGYEAKVVQALTPMTPSHKSKVNKKIDDLQVDGLTNLWGGIHQGLKLFESEGQNGRVPALMVLTDGQPNHMCPTQGYVDKLRSRKSIPAIINTFGFGYSIISGLLKCIAEAGNGNYAFIPDAGMIGTVFVHAVAHLQSTYATRCVLKISAPYGVLLKSTTGITIDQTDEDAASETMEFQLGNLQYGQSRDIYLETVNQEGKRVVLSDGIVRASLRYSRMRAPEYVTVAEQNVSELTSLPSSMEAYHQSRSMICKLLSSYFTVKTDREYTSDQSGLSMETLQMRLQNVIDSIPAKHHDDQHNMSLMADLNGQIKEALSKREFFNRWGRHYYLSIWNAHAKQLCNSFKDPGPLMYNDNPFFARCRDALDSAFDDLPAPQPSKSRGFKASRPVVMSSYNSRSAPCFAGSSPVLLATGNHETGEAAGVVPVGSLTRGQMVQTPAGPRAVRALLKTNVRRTMMCRVGEAGLLATPWHPVARLSKRDGNAAAEAWVFPADIAEQMTEYSGDICSVFLEPDGDSDAHAIHIGGVWGVTLGHGILSGDDIRAHRFLGNYEAVSAELMALGPGEDGVYHSAGVRRDVDSGKVCGFERLLPAADAVGGGSLDYVTSKSHNRLPEICV